MAIVPLPLRSRFTIGETDKVFDRLIQTGRPRREDAARRVALYEGRHGEALAEAIARRWSDPGSFRPFWANFVKRIVDSISWVYSEEPTRRFAGWDDGAGRDLYEAMRADDVLRHAHRMARLCRTVLIKVGYDRELGHPTLEVWTPDRADVVAEGGHLRRVVLHHVVPDHRRPTRPQADHVIYADWTPETFTWRSAHGRPVASDANPEATNPFGVLPFIPVHDGIPRPGDDSFWQPGGDDLAELQLAIDVQLVHLAKTLELQGFGQPVVTGLAAETAVRTGVDRVLTLPDGAKFDIVAPRAPISEHIEAIEFLISKMAVSYNLSGEVLQVDPRVKSGSAKESERRDLIELRRQDVSNFRHVERRLFDVVRTVVNTFEPGAVPEDATISVDFADPSTSVSESDRLDNARKRLELGVWSPVDAYMAQNPDVTDRDEALERVQRNAAERDMTIGGAP
ncbi:MAG: phage portal protein [Azospirillaceae bacterium]